MKNNKDDVPWRKYQGMCLLIFLTKLNSVIYRLPCHLYVSFTPSLLLLRSSLLLN